MNVAEADRAQYGRQYSMDVQTALSRDTMLDMGDHGSRGSKLVQVRAFDQAGDATGMPIRGETTNTLANLAVRQPIEGFSPAAATTVESEGASWYNALGISLHKRFSHGLQFLASYTWTSALETDPGYVSGTLDGGTLGQGQRLTILERNELNAFGTVDVDQDRAQVSVVRRFCCQADSFHLSLTSSLLSLSVPHYPEELPGSIRLQLHHPQKPSPEADGLAYSRLLPRQHPFQ